MVNTCFYLTVSWVFPECFQVFGMSVSWVFPGHFRSLAYVFPECFLVILGLSHECFLSVSMSFQVFGLCVSWVFPGVFRSFGECFLSVSWVCLKFTLHVNWHLLIVPNYSFTVLALLLLVFNIYLLGLYWIQCNLIADILLPLPSF